MPISSKPSLTTGVLLLLLLLLNSFSHVAAQTNSGDSDELVQIMRQPGAGELSALCAPKKGPFSRHTCKCPDRPEDLLSILRNKAQQQFCRAYIDINPKVTRTVTTTATRCGNTNPNCTATTIQATVVETQEVKNTVTADTPTVTIPTIATVIAPTQYVVITVTSTVGTPLETPAPVLKRRGRPAPVPGFLNSYNRYRISSACSALLKDQITTTTKYQTKTATVSGTIPTSTLTIVAHVTNTLVITITPEPVTITNTVSTTTIINTETTTTTTTICPVVTQQASLLGITTPGKLELGGVDLNTAVKCCSECYYRPSGGCAAWIFFAFGSGGTCGLGIFTDSNPEPQVGKCPLGLRNYELGTSGDASSADVGGTGPCAGTNVYRG